MEFVSPYFDRFALDPCKDYNSKKEGMNFLDEFRTLLSRRSYLALT